MRRDITEIRERAADMREEAMKTAKVTKVKKKK
jgi:hypothetical protein